MSDHQFAPQALFAAHPRAFDVNRYVYPVLSRRAGGISIGVNLNLDRICNFDCVYCQVDRREAAERQPVNVAALAQELERMVLCVLSGRLFDERPFSQTPPELRRLNDIALSGDGEPTTFPNFDTVAEACAGVRRRHGLDDLKLVLISNATMFHRPRVRRGLEVLDSNNGEIWAKLDAGTEAFYHRVARTAVPFGRILDNLRWAAAARPIVIQSLFMRLGDDPPPDAEIEAYCGRLGEIAAAGAIKLVQVHTVARTPAESWVRPLSMAEVDAIAARVEQTGLRVARYYGA